LRPESSPPQTVADPPKYWWWMPLSRLPDEPDLPAPFHRHVIAMAGFGRSCEAHQSSYESILGRSRTG